MKLPILLLIVGLAGPKAFAKTSNKVIAGTIANSCMSQGSLVGSRGPLDIGISGFGWIPLQKKDGTVLFTRYGKLGMDKDGNLSHLPSGLPVVTINKAGKLQKINIAAQAVVPFFDNSSRDSVLGGISFRDNGELEGFYSDGQTRTLATLQLATLENQRKMKLIDKKSRIYSAPPEAGEVGFGQPLSGIFGKVFSKMVETPTPLTACD